MEQFQLVDMNSAIMIIWKGIFMSQIFYHLPNNRSFKISLAIFFFFSVFNNFPGWLSITVINYLFTQNDIFILSIFFLLWIFSRLLAIYYQFLAYQHGHFISWTITCIFPLFQSYTTLAHKSGIEHLLR